MNTFGKVNAMLPPKCDDGIGDVDGVDEKRYTYLQKILVVQKRDVMDVHKVWCYVYLGKKYTVELT